MSSDPFDVLGLDRKTATDADVRRAYAAQLKVTRPEDDRAGFMALRAAFERARDEIRWRDEEAEYEQDHSPPDEYGQSTAHLMAAKAEAPAGDLTVLRDGDAVPDTGTSDEAKAEDTGEDEYGVPYPTPEEAAYHLRIDTAMDRLVDALTATGSAPSLRQVMESVDHPDVSGIEEYQSLQWRVRQLLCDRTGYFLDSREIRLPDWLTLEIFDALDNYYGWTRQPTTNGYVRGMNDWLVRVRREIGLQGKPAGARRAAALQDVKAELFDDDASPQDRGRSSGGGGNVWLWIGAGILISQIVRFVGSAG